MNAGRELDALVAEKVMGWKRIADYPPGTPAWETKQPARDRFGYHLRTWEDFAPSTGIAEAWEVVERLRVKPIGPFIVIVGCYDSAGLGNNGIGCEIKDGVGGAWNAFADTAPLAICLAALNAVGVDT